MKKKVILGSTLAILMCSSLITGATMALFTSDTKVNISVSGGKVDVSATLKSYTTYSQGAETATNGEFELGGTAKVEGGTLSLVNFMPMDKVVVELEVTNTSSVAYKQRVSLTSAGDDGFMDQLIVGLSDDNAEYTYYSDYVTEWENKKPVTEPETTTMYLSIELPEYVSSDWQGKSCEISLALEAVQGNADVAGEAVANKVYLVDNQEELTSTLKSMSSGETVILYGGEENWATANVEYLEEDAKEITVRGYDVGEMTINVPYGTVNLYNNVTELTVTAVADNSLHIYGDIGGATLESGRTVVEAGASVSSVNVIPAENATAKVEVVKEAEVESITVETKEGSSAEVVIAEDVTVSDMVVSGSGSVNVENNGTIDNTTVEEGSTFNNMVSTAEQLLAALNVEGATATLSEDISIDAALLQSVINNNSVKKFAIDLNEKTLTLTGNTLNMLGENVALTIKNGCLNADNSQATNASIMVGSSCSIALDGVNVAAKGAFLFPRGDAAKVEINKCDISVEGVYAVATNAATTDNYNVVISIIDSSIEMLSADSSAVMINVAGTLEMSNVDINAQRQGIVVRAGEANLNNVNVVAKIPYLDWEYDKNYANNPSNWGSGNEIPYGALVVGNQQESAYKADAVVTIEGGSYTCTAQEEKVKERASALYAIKGTTRATSVTMSGATFEGKIVNYNKTATLKGFEDYTVITALIASASEWAKIDDIVMANPDEDYYFQQIADIEFTSNITKFCGTYDGNGYKVTRAKNFGAGKVAGMIDEIVGHTVVKDTNLYMYDPTTIILLADWGTCYGVDMINVTTNSLVGVIKCNANNFGFFIVNALYTGSEKPVEYNFINCTNNASIENTGTCTGVFVGSGPCANGTLVVNYENCINNGEIIGANFVGYLYGNPSYIDSMKQEEYPDSKINVVNCKNNGTLRSNAENAIVAVAPNYSDVIADSVVTGTGSLISENAIKDLEFTINQTGDKFSITTDNTSYNYKLAFSVAVTYFTKNGEAWTEEHTADIPERNLSEVSNGLKYLVDLSVSEEATGGLLTVKAYDNRTVVSEGVLTAEEVAGLSYNANNYGLYVKDGVTYMVFNVTEDYYINSSVSVLLYAYEADTLVGIKTVK